MSRARIELPMEPIAEFCRRWQIVESALFGSVPRDDFCPDSDIDLLVSFAPGVHWPWGGFARIGDQLEQLLGRPVDIVEKRAMEEHDNPLRRRHILSNLEQVYLA